MSGFDWRYLLPFSLLATLLVYLLLKSSEKRTEQPDMAVDVSSSEPESGTVNQPVTSDREADLADIRLLLVSSRPSETGSLRRQLSDWGIDFNLVPSSVQAFSELFAAAKSDNPYRTVLVDIPHLDMDDCQFANALRTEPALQSLYLLHYGGNTQPNRAEQLYSAGWSGILSSPVDKTLLFNALHSASETSGSRSESNVIQLLDHYKTDSEQQPLDILVGCKNDSECQRIRKMLTTAGHQAFVVSDSTQIPDALENHHFDLAILEEETGDISGTEAIKLYRFAHMNERWIPFILLLDNPTSATMSACESGGIDHLLLKPVNARRLLETINRALEDRTHDGEICSYPPSRGLQRFHDNELILDTHQLEELRKLGKDPLFLVDLINQFVEETEQLVERLRTAADSKDIERTRNIGHQIKDAAGNLGALSLYRLAVRISRTGGDAREWQPDQLLSDIEACRMATIGALHEYLAEGDNPAYRKD
ncbi:MAG: Hpt domain-containing protein [Sedimenticola sp.]|nr:Hpt domain-containing protein [Sedimenticola sp.]